MFVATARFDLLLGDVRSLKQKRSVVRPVVAALRRLDVSVAEVGHLDLHRRAEVAVAAVAADARRCQDVVDRCELLVADHREVEILAVRRGLFRDEDE